MRFYFRIVKERDAYGDGDVGPYARPPACLKSVDGKFFLAKFDMSEMKAN
jgi:hypothetical protein